MSTIFFYPFKRRDVQFRTGKDKTPIQITPNIECDMCHTGPEQELFEVVETHPWGCEAFECNTFCESCLTQQIAEEGLNPQSILHGYKN